MKTRREKTRFGQLLAIYLEERRCSEAALERLLIKNNYDIAHGLVSKYEYGIIRPNAEFVVQVALVLALRQDEAQALVDLHLADVNFRFLNDFRNAWNRWVE